jgi:hypothetical protein
MGQTPPTDLKLRPIVTPASGGWALVRVLENGGEEIAAAPFDTWASACVGWRIAGHYVRPAPAGVEAWTMVHIDGWCGADQAGCPHCSAIAADPRSTAHARDVLANRRNLPIGYGQGVRADPYAAERAGSLT